MGYGAIAALFVAQTIGALLGATAVGVADSPLFRLGPLALATALGLLVATLSPAYLVLMAAIVVAGCAGYAISTRAQADLSHGAAGRRGHALGVFHVWGGVGSVFLPLALSLMLLAGLPWRSAPALMAVAYVAYLVLGRGAALSPPPQPVRGLRGIDATARWSATVAVLGTGVQLTVPLWLPTLLVDAYATSQAAASASVSAYAVALLAARVAATCLLPVVGEANELRASVALALTGYSILALAGGPVLVVLGAMLVGAGVGPLLPLGVGRTIRATGDDRLASSLVMAAASGAQIVLPALVVVLATVVGLQSALAATAVAIVVAGVAVRRSGRGLAAAAGRPLRQASGRAQGGRAMRP